MRAATTTIAIAALACACACGGKHGTIPDGATGDGIMTPDSKDITSFAFTKADNPGLARDVTATIVGDEITAVLPIGTASMSLVASFATTGASVSIAGAPQTTDMTANDFTRVQTYTVTALDGSTKTFTAFVVVGGFSQHVDLAVGNNSTTVGHVAIADFNGDGKPDVAVVNVTNTSGTTALSIFPNTTPAGASLPTFGARVDITVAFSSGSFQLAVADFNGDGKPDVAMTTQSSSVAVMLNTTATGVATPSFTGPSTFTTTNTSMSIAVGDFNGDGKPDIAVGTSCCTTNVDVLLNTTTTGSVTPTFATHVDFALSSTSTTTFAIAVADFNGDGMPDIAATNNNNSSVDVLLNSAAMGATMPSFQSPTRFSGVSGQTSAITTDVNGDGIPDVVVANGSSAFAMLDTTATNATTPTFSAAAGLTFSPSSQPVSVASADMDGDGRVDLVFTNNNFMGGRISILLDRTTSGATTPSFANAIDIPFADGNFVTVAVADFNGDGKPDLAVTDVVRPVVTISLAE